MTFPLRYSTQLIELKWNWAQHWQKHNHEINSIYGELLTALWQSSLRREEWIGSCQNDKKTQTDKQHPCITSWQPLQFLIFNTHFNNCHQSLCLIFAWCHVHTKYWVGCITDSGLLLSHEDDELPADSLSICVCVERVQSINNHWSGR